MRRQIAVRLPRVVSLVRDIEALTMAPLIATLSRAIHNSRETPAIAFRNALHGFRYPYFLLYALIGAGAQVAYDFSNAPDLYRRIGPRALLRHGVPVQSEPNVVAFLAPSGGRSPSEIRISESYFSRFSSTEALVDATPGAPALLPYFAHPRMLQLIDRSTHNPSRSRPVRIGFAGRVGATYDKLALFDQLPRQQLVDTLIHERRASVQIAESRHDAPRWNAPIVLSLTETRSDSIRAHAVTGLDFLRFLQDCDFFLALPGLRMPHAHNLIEAMSQGAIPILNYADWMKPALADGVDCLTFDSADRFLSAVDRALAMSRDEVMSMRLNVLRYYERILSPKAVGRQLLDKAPVELIVNAEMSSVADYLSRKDGEPRG